MPSLNEEQLPVVAELVGRGVPVECLMYQALPGPQVGYLYSLLTSVWFWVSVILLIVALLYKYRKDRRIEIICKETPRNTKIVEILDKLITSYSPTFYIPFSMVKMYMCTDKKVQPLLTRFLYSSLILEWISSSQTERSLRSIGIQETFAR